MWDFCTLHSPAWPLRHSGMFIFSYGHWIHTKSSIASVWLILFVPDMDRNWCSMTRVQMNFFISQTYTTTKNTNYQQAAWLYIGIQQSHTFNITYTMLWGNASQEAVALDCVICLIKWMVWATLLDFNQIRPFKPMEISYGTCCPRLVRSVCGGDRRLDGSRAKEPKKKQWIDEFMWQEPGQLQEDSASDSRSWIAEIKVTDQISSWHLTEPIGFHCGWIYTFNFRFDERQCHWDPSIHYRSNLLKLKYHQRWTSCRSKKKYDAYDTLRFGLDRLVADSKASASNRAVREDPMSSL